MTANRGSVRHAPLDPSEVESRWINKFLQHLQQKD
jgi:hypothetical protein